MFHVLSEKIEWYRRYPFKFYVCHKQTLVLGVYKIFQPRITQLLSKLKM